MHRCDLRVPGFSGWICALIRCELEVAGAAARQRLMAGKGAPAPAWAGLTGSVSKPGSLPSW